MSSRTHPQPGQTVMGFVLPETSWTRPTGLPDLVGQGARRVAVDLETRDDGLRAGRGAGWATGRGYVCGVAVAWEGGSLYAPLAHPDTDNMDADAVMGWIRGIFRSDVEVVTQNGPYDYGWLGMVPEHRQDTMFAAYMIDENRREYGLGALLREQGLPGKDQDALIAAGKTLGLGRTTAQVKGNLWQMPAHLVGDYAEADAVGTLALWGKLEPLLVREDVAEAYQLEIEIMPLCIEMRRRGVRIDTEGAERAAAMFRDKRDVALRRLTELVPVGRAVTMEDVRSARWLEGVFQSTGLHFRRTEKSNQGEFQSKWMERHPHEIPRLVAEARGHEDAATKFCEGFLLDYAHRGRLHAEIRQTKSEEGGTVSYRFAYADPPLQQMPSPKRDRELGLAIRRLFLPDEGEQWGSVDYSQQEYRLMVHFAVAAGLPGAGDAARRYEEDPLMDFHKMVAEMTGLERKPAKDCNFAKIYGAGRDKFAEMIGKSPEEAEAIMTRYDEELPFPKMLAEMAKSVAVKRGHVRLLDGARCRFDLWEPGYGYEGPRLPAARREEAFGRAAKGSGHAWEGARLRRAYVHKAMNRLVQGSAARQTKMAMRDLWREGIVPTLQVHDELNVTGDEALTRRVQQLMVETAPLLVPMRADASIGPNWADQEKLT